jgi:hypothetical protein
MAAVAEVRDYLTAAENRGDHGEVVEVAGRLPRVVGDKHVIRLQSLGRDFS